MQDNAEAFLGIESPAATAPLESSATDHAHPLYGIHGFLEFWVVVNMYVAPALFALQQLIAWIGYGLMAERYPGIIVVGLFGTTIIAYLAVRGIRAAKAIRGHAPRAVQNVRALLKLSLALTVISIPISFLSGLPAGQLMVGTIKSIVIGGIGFAVQYTYFNVSKRVQANFPDWKE